MTVSPADSQNKTQVQILLVCAQQHTNMSGRKIAQAFARSSLQSSSARSWSRPQCLPRPFSSSSAYHSAASAPSAFGHRPFARTFHTTNGPLAVFIFRRLVLTPPPSSRPPLWHRPPTAWHWVRLRKAALPILALIRSFQHQGALQRPQGQPHQNSRSQRRR